MARTLSYPLLVSGLVVALCAALAASMMVGPAAAGTFELFNLFARGDGDVAWMIVREIRLPRTILAAMIGFTLGLTGAALQGFLRNPLADPGVVGVSSAGVWSAVSPTSSLRRWWRSGRAPSRAGMRSRMNRRQVRPLDRRIALRCRQAGMAKQFLYFPRSAPK